MGQLYNPVEFYRYEKISDDIMGLGKNAILKFNVGLARTVNNNRVFYYKEYQYDGKNKTPSVVIKRSYDYYLSLENYTKQSNEDKAFIRIGVREFPLFEQAIENVIKWFMDKKYEKLFFKNSKGKLSISSPIPDYKIEHLPMDKWILFEPIIIDNIDFQEPGVRISLSSLSNFTDITVDALFGLQHILKNMNMFMVAQIMLSAMPAPIGTNRAVLDDGSSSSYKFKEINKTSSIEGRFIGKPKIENL